MECTGKFFRLGRKSVSLKSDLLEQNVSFSRKLVARVLRYLPRNKQKPSQMQIGPITGRRLLLRLLFAKKERLHLTPNLVTFFSV